MIEDFEAQLPHDFDEITLDQRVQDRNPYVCVVLQEVARMNILLRTIRASLGELKLGLQGALNMSDAMEDLMNAMGLNRVCALWQKYSYFSLKNLAAWFADMLLRSAQLDKWIEGSDCPSKTVPISLWISALFNPMAYITAILQVTARMVLRSLYSVHPRTFSRILLLYPHDTAGDCSHSRTAFGPNGSLD